MFHQRQTPGKGRLGTTELPNYALYHNLPSISTVKTVKNTSKLASVLRQEVEIDAPDMA